MKINTQANKKAVKTRLESFLQLGFNPRKSRQLKLAKI